MDGAPQELDGGKWMVNKVTEILRVNPGIALSIERCVWTKVHIPGEP